MWLKVLAEWKLHDGHWSSGWWQRQRQLINTGSLGPGEHLAEALCSS